MTDVAQIVDEGVRSLWVSTVLAVAESGPNRRAFLDGYNGQPCEAPRTERKMAWHLRGELVRTALLSKEGESADA